MQDSDMPSLFDPFIELTWAGAVLYGFLRANAASSCFLVQAQDTMKAAEILRSLISS